MEKFIPVEDAVLRDTFWNAAIDLKKENDELKQRIKRLEDALVSIREYWNRDKNQRAMVDACWYAIEISSEAV
jgi:cell division septum initiation protein DivIVA